MILDDTAYWLNGLDMQNIYIDGLIMTRWEEVWMADKLQRVVMVDQKMD